MRERRSERRSVAAANASQTRPDQTRVLVTAVCGVSINESIHRLGPFQHQNRLGWMTASRMFGGGC